MERTGTERTFLAARSLKKLIGDLPTPFYLYDEKGIRAGVRTLFEAFEGETGLTVRYPMRLNPNPSILRLLKECGCGVFCRTTGELMLAKRIGFSGDEVVYAPFCRDAEGEQLSDEMGAIRLVGGNHVLPDFPPRRVMLCYNPTEGLMFDKIPVSVNREVIGLSEEEILDMADRFHTFGTESISLCMLARPLDEEPNFYPAVADRLFRLAVQLRERLGITVDCCDLGEGLGWFEEQAPDDKALRVRADTIRALREQILVPAGLGEMRLSMMPGRYLTGRHGLFVMRVMAVKEGIINRAVVDASFSSYLRPALFVARHTIQALGKGNERVRIPYEVLGYTGDRRDRFVREQPLPELKEGDLLLVCDAGFEGGALMSSFGMVPRCAEYLVRSMDEIVCIRKAQSVDELVDSFF